MITASDFSRKMEDGLILYGNNETLTAGLSKFSDAILADKVLIQKIESRQVSDADEYVVSTLTFTYLEKADKI